MMKIIGKASNERKEKAKKSVMFFETRKNCINKIMC